MSFTEVNLTLYGEGGHSATLPKRTAVEKVKRLMQYALFIQINTDLIFFQLRRLLAVTSKFRDHQRQIKLSRAATDYGSYTSINVNIIRVSPP